jgi:HemY protein
LNAIFELSLRTGDLERALDAVDEMRKRGLVPRDAAKRRRGAVLTELARWALGDARDAFARDYSREAYDLAPELVPAACVRAQVLLEDGRNRAAAKVVEKTWARQPHPDLVDLYLRARPGRTAVDGYKRVQKLAEKHPGHRESELALGRTALQAELWGEARRHLMAAGGEAPSEEVCRLLADLEEREKDDRETARAWLMRATDAPADPAWVCGSCGAVAGEWRATCGACGSFDSFGWRTPPRVVEPDGGSAALARLEPTARANAIEDAETSEVPADEPARVDADAEAEARKAERQPS